MALPRSRTERFHQSEGYDRFRKRNPLRARVVSRKLPEIAQRNPVAFNRAVRAVVSAIKKVNEPHFSTNKRDNSSIIAATKLVLIDRGFVSRKEIEEILGVEKEIRDRRACLTRSNPDKALLQIFENDILLDVLKKDLAKKLGKKISLPEFRGEVSRTGALIKSLAKKQVG